MADETTTEDTIETKGPDSEIAPTSIDLPCAFCDKTKEELGGYRVIQGKLARICQDCIDVCISIIYEDHLIERDGEWYIVFDDVTIRCSSVRNSYPNDGDNRRMWPYRLMFDNGGSMLVSSRCYGTYKTWLRGFTETEENNQHGS